MLHAKVELVPKKLRIDVWNTWIGKEVGIIKCPLCNLVDIQQGACNGWDCGHIVPACIGGETTIDNLRPICKGCNSSMGGKDLREFCKFYPGSLERLKFDDSEKMQIESKKAELENKAKSIEDERLATELLITAVVDRLKVLENEKLAAENEKVNLEYKMESIRNRATVVENERANLEDRIKSISVKPVANEPSSTDTDSESEVCEVYLWWLDLPEMKQLCRMFGIYPASGDRAYSSKFACGEHIRDHGITEQQVREEIRKHKHEKYIYICRGGVTKRHVFFSNKKTNGQWQHKVICNAHNRCHTKCLGGNLFYNAKL